MPLLRGVPRPRPPARARPNLAALAFALACAARSNGALNLAFLAHDFAFARVGAAAWFGIRARRAKPRRRTVGYETTPFTDRLAATVAFAARFSVAVAPLLAAQALGYRTYCAGANSDGSANRRANVPRPWCDRWTPFPNIYAFVQSEYWNVGFLRYYQARQLQEPALAAPALGASAAAAAAVGLRRDEPGREKTPRGVDVGREGGAVSRRVGGDGGGGGVGDARAGGDAVLIDDAGAVLVPREGREDFGGDETSDVRLFPRLRTPGNAHVPRVLPVDLVRDGRDGRDGRDETESRRSRSL